MLIRSGIILVKYWFSISDTEQERRFLANRECRGKVPCIEAPQREVWGDPVRKRSQEVGAQAQPTLPQYILQ